MNPLKINEITIAGVARNCAKTLEGAVRSISNAFCIADTVKWIVVESDSDDDTCRLLSDIQTSRPGFHFHCLGNLRDVIPARTERIAHCRNIYLQEFLFSPDYAGSEYLVVADLDDYNSLLTADGVQSCFTRSDWSAVFANQLGPYYDIWALRHPLWCPDDCWREVEEITSDSVSYSQATWEKVSSRMVTVDPKWRWLQVQSAFGGLGIYTRSALLGARYNGFTFKHSRVFKNQVCEHVSVNEKIFRTGGKLYINPSLLTCDFNEHNSHLRPANDSQPHHAARLISGDWDGISRAQA
jgi:glycosyltransferase involved in cell wall biosynthesis